jgi:hypothetical protein
MPITDDQSRELMDALNGQLLDELQVRLEPINWVPRHWVVNVLLLERQLAETEVVSLRTSATLYKGERFYSEADCAPDKAVKGLSGRVPLNRSFTAYCIRNSVDVWVDSLEATSRSEDDPLRNEYRGWEYVKVDLDARPDSEYVFPIRTKVTISQAILGALNFEWYGTDYADHNEFEMAGRSKVTHRVSRLLDQHGPFLLLARMPEVQSHRELLMSLHRNSLSSGREQPLGKDNSTTMERDKEMQIDSVHYQSSQAPKTNEKAKDAPRIAPAIGTPSPAGDQESAEPQRI